MNVLARLLPCALACAAAVCAGAAAAGTVTVDAAPAQVAMIDLLGTTLTLGSAGGLLGDDDLLLAGTAFSGVVVGSGTLNLRDADAAGTAGQQGVKVAADSHLVVPEPSSAALAGAALAAATSAALGIRRRRRVHM